MKRLLLVWLLCMSLPSLAQIAIDKTVSFDNPSTASTVTSPAFSTSAANELLLAFVELPSGATAGNSVTGVTGGGLTWTLARRNNVQKGSAEIWKAYATTVLTNAMVKATTNGSYRSTITVMTFTGAKSTLGAIQGASSATGAPSVQLTTTASNSWVFGNGNDPSHSTARTVPGPNCTTSAGQCMVHQYLTSSRTGWVQRQNTATATPGTVKINDTAPTADAWNMAAVEVLAVPPAVTLTSIDVLPLSATIGVNDPLQFTSRAHYSNGDITTVTGSTDWQSANPAIASIVATSGLATGRGAGGPITITGTYQGQTDTSQLTVNAAHYVDLAWTKGSETCAQTPDVKYSVWRSTVSGQNGAQIASGLALTAPITWKDTGVTAGATYYYHVTETDQCTGVPSAFSSQSLPAVIPSP